MLSPLDPAARLVWPLHRPATSLQTRSEKLQLAPPHLPHHIFSRFAPHAARSGSGVPRRCSPRRSLPRCLLCAASRPLRRAAPQLAALVPSGRAEAQGVEQRRELQKGRLPSRSRSERRKRLRPPERV